MESSSDHSLQGFVYFTHIESRSSFEIYKSKFRDVVGPIPPRAKIRSGFKVNTCARIFHWIKLSKLKMEAKYFVDCRLADLIHRNLLDLKNGK